MTELLIFVVLNCSMARYNGRLHCIVGVLPTCYKRKAATYFYRPGGTGPQCMYNYPKFEKKNIIIILNGILAELLAEPAAAAMHGPHNLVRSGN